MVVRNTQSFVAILAICVAGASLTRSQLPASGQPAPMWAAPPSGSTSNAGPLVVSSQMLVDGNQQVIVIDSRNSTMATYLVESVTGRITLRSVRNMTFDLQMEEFNGNPPTPGEIRQTAAVR